MVSTIITTHNRLTLLRRALQSILSQSYINMEIVVVADGCNDGTNEYITDLSRRIPNLKYIINYSAKGSNASRNLGISSSRGEFVAFLDDDDEWLPTKIEKQVELLETNPEIGIVSCGQNTIFVAKDNTRYVSYIKKRQTGDLSKEILFGNYLGVTSAVMVRRNLFSQEMWDEKMPALQDWDLWIRLCQISLVANIEECLFNYYIYEKKNVQITHNNDIYLECKDMAHKKYKHLYERLSSQEKKDLKYTELNGYYIRCLINGENAKARSAILQAFRIKHHKILIKRYFKTFFPYKWSLKKMK